MNSGRVYWITGFSNSGKTTIGNALYYKLKKERDNIVILDGDILKEIASGTDLAMFELSDRMTRAKRYSQMAKMLSDQGMWVIVCAIAMFDKVREWNRKNIKEYIEIFLDVPTAVLKERNRKGLYTEEKAIELPKSPDIVIHNDGNESIRDIVERIMRLNPQNNEDFDRDRQYWNKYYQKIAKYQVEPSDFAKLIEGKLPINSHILELGCGNGRDSLFFLRNGHDVIAIDASDVAIEKLNEITSNEENALFVCDNFVKCKPLYQMKYECIYSRFTLHAITEEQEDELLANVKEALYSGGIFCIEARTIHDEIFGKGIKIAHNTFEYNNHFRRFINVEEFADKLEQFGFDIIMLEEAQGFSKTKDSNPILMRCIACVH